MNTPENLPQFINLLEHHFGPEDNPKKYVLDAKYIEGVEFDNSACFTCTKNCCSVKAGSDEYIALAEDDLKIIYEHYPDAPRIPEDQLVMGPDGRRYYHITHGTCPYLGPDNLCTVYAHRPRWCRDWPGNKFYTNGWEDLEFTLERCPGATYNNPVLCLNSGGMDSLVLLAWLKHKGYTPYSLFVDYGQPTANMEEEAARNITAYYGGKFFKETIRLDLWKRFPFFYGKRHPTYELNMIVPMRNMVLFSLAATYCDSLNIPKMGLAWDGKTRGSDVISPAKDKHRKFVNLLNEAFDESSELYWESDKPLEIIAPLLNHTKLQIGQIGKRLKVPFEISWSCYESGRRTPCNSCGRCKERNAALIRLNYTTEYRPGFSQNNGEGGMDK